MIQATPGRIILEHIDENKTASGLFLSDDRKEKSYLKGKVVSVGSTYTSKSGKVWNTAVSVGDTCYVRRIPATRIKNMIFSAFEDILCFIKG